MWSPSCILEQRGFQPAIVCKTRVLLIASATVRFIGVAILWVPIASAPAGYGPEGVEPLQLQSHQRVLLALQTGVSGEGVNSRCNLGNACRTAVLPSGADTGRFQKSTRQVR